MFSAIWEQEYVGCHRIGRYLIICPLLINNSNSSPFLMRRKYALSVWLQFRANSLSICKNFRFPINVWEPTHFYVDQFCRKHSRRSGSVWCVLFEACGLLRPLRSSFHLNDQFLDAQKFPFADHYNSYVNSNTLDNHMQFKSKLKWFDYCCWAITRVNRRIAWFIQTKNRFERKQIFIVH